MSIFSNMFRRSLVQTTPESTSQSKPQQPSGAFLGIREEAETLGGRTVVRDGRTEGRDVRYLLVNGTQQSAMWLDDPYGECVFKYLQKFDIALDEGQAQRVLLIGGAGYGWPRHVLSAYPEVDLTVVELDPMMNDLARRWFYLDELEATYGCAGTGRLSLVCADGLRYLRECADTGEHFDVIVNDTFIAGAMDQSLLGPEAAKLVKACLTPKGLYLANVVSALTGPRAGILTSTCDSFANEFEQVSVIPISTADPDYYTNCVVVASCSDRTFMGTWLTISGCE